MSKDKILIGKKGNIHPGYVYAAFIPVQIPQTPQMVNSTFPKRMIKASRYSVVDGTWKEMMRNFEISKRSEKIQKIRNRMNELHNR